MKWFLNLSMGFKLTLGFGIMVFLIIFIEYLAYFSIKSNQNLQETLYKGSMPLVTTLLELNSAIHQQRNDILELLDNSGIKDHTLIKQDLYQQIRKIKESFQKLDDNVLKFPAIEKQIDDFKKLRDSYQNTQDTQTLPLIESGKYKEAHEIVSGVQSGRILQMRELSQELIDTALKQMDKEIFQSKLNFERYIQIFIGAALISFLISGFMILFFNKGIVRPMKDIIKATEKISQGNLDIRLPDIVRDDEVGKLNNNFNFMLEGLKQFVTEISHATQVLSKAVNQISVSTTQLASSASETATSVSETTTTIEEVRQTAKVASDKAKSVAEGTQHVAEVSQEGEKSAQEMGEGMVRIRDQMNFIAEGMMRLSEQTQAINSIITTVDDLAQQSNLLAVNASIEAAKAGEQGRGFNVVAQEIKSLADQSKQATSQVRTILNDIQKATNAAVLSTEQGGKVVESGVKRSEQVVESIAALANSVVEASHAASQIATSSHQQLIGTEQAAVAMENIKQASAQNVESAKQLEAAANGIQELGKKLLVLVQRYRLHKGNNLYERE